MRYAFILLPFLLTGALQAQGVLGGGQSFEIPTASLGDADHATVAVNARGDVFVAFHTQRTDIGGIPRQVEGALFYSLGASQWETPAVGYNHFVLGDPSVAPMGSGFAETCRKPDVVAVGDDFIVTWPRTPDGQDTSWLEAVLIRPAAGGLTVVDAPAPGTGYVIDANVAKGSAGVMPDLSSAEGQPGIAHVVYAHAESSIGDQREFDLRHARIDFSVSPPIVTGPSVLVDDLPFDDPTGNGGPAGGKVLPDVVQDDYGYLVVTWEAYQLVGHNGAVSDEAWIETARFDMGSGVPVRLDSVALMGRFPDSWQRRPNLASSRLDSSNTVGLSWMDTGLLPGSDVDSWHVELDFQGGPVAGLIAVNDLAYLNEPGRDDLVPVPVKAHLLNVNIAARGTAFGNQLMAWLPGYRNRLMPLTPRTATAWRASADLLEVPNGGGFNKITIPVSFEAPGATGLLRAFLVIFLKQ